MTYIQSAYKTVGFKVSDFKKPKNKTELVNLVNWARQNKKKLKVVGGAHSFNNIFYTNDVLVDLSDVEDQDDLKNITVNASNNEVTVGAARTLREVVVECDKHNLHFPSLGSFYAQTIPGAIATSTHGSSLHFGSLSDIVEEVEILKSDGTIVSYSKGSTELKALCCHLGQLGILTQVRLKLVPAFWLHCDINSQPAPQAFQQILQVANSNEYVSMLWVPDTDIACTRVLSSPQNMPTRRNKAAINLEDRFVKTSNIRHRLYDLRIFFAGHAYLSRWLNPLVRQRYASGVEQEFCFDKGVLDKSYKVFLYDHYREPTENHRLRMLLNVEYAFDVNELQDLLNELRRALQGRRNNGQHLNFPRVHVRFAKQGDSLIGLNADRDTAYVAIYVVGSINHKSQIPIAKEVEEIFIKFGGRPHWGKYSYVWGQKNNSYIPQAAKDYPNYGTFLSVRNQLDPDKMFLSREDMFEGLSPSDAVPSIGELAWSVVDPDEYQEIPQWV